MNYISHYIIAIRQRIRLMRVALLPVKKLVPSGESNSIVVSLTTYPKRINTVHLTIKSLMSQSIAPDKVVLYLGNDVEDSMVTTELHQLEDKGLEIRTGYDNIRSHKKYQFAMKEYADALIVLADDDLVYPYDLIASLLKMHKLYPESIIARRTHKITFDEENNILPYDMWIKEFIDENPSPKKSLIATTGAGSLYPPSVFDKLLVYKSEMQRLSITADDIWLKVLETMGGINVVYAPNDCPMPMCIPGTQDSSLASINNGEDENTKTFTRLLEYFNLDNSLFIDND